MRSFFLNALKKLKNAKHLVTKKQYLSQSDI